MLNITQKKKTKMEEKQEAIDPKYRNLSLCCNADKVTETVWSGGRPSRVMTCSCCGQKIY